jgi:hypothetical protein
MIAGITDTVKMHEFRIVSALVLIESIVLVYFSLQTGEAVGQVSYLYFNSATLGHFIAYLVYGGLLTRMFSGNGKAPYLAVIVGAAFGLLNEMIQSGVPGRSMSMIDVAVNAAGALVGSFVSARIR